MKKIVFVFVVLVHISVAGNERMAGGKIVYIVPGSIYTSLGSNAALADSARIAVIRKGDTIAVLQVIAVSSKSSVCKIIDSIRAPQIGDSVVATVAISQPSAAKPMLQQDTAALASQQSAASERSMRPVRQPGPIARFSGQIGLQYSSLMSPNSAYTMEQPGLLLSLRGESSLLPLKFDFYGILRSTGVGGVAPFSGNALNNSRVYRMSFVFDDRANIFSVGRMMPVYMSSAGYIDGVSAAHRFGKVTAGVAVGYQPDPILQSLSTETKKVLAYALYEGAGNWNTRIGASFVDSWTARGTERQAISTLLSFYSVNGLSLYSSADIDFRVASGGRSVSQTSLTQLLCSASYRLSDYVTLGAGVDASRPLYDRALTALIPDSLLDRKLKSGVSLNTNIMLVRGISVFVTYLSRIDEKGNTDGSIGSTSIMVNDIVRSGVSLRANYLANDNSVALTHGYGVSLQRNLFGLDCGIRYQQNRSNILNLSMTAMSTTVGFDVAAIVVGNLNLIGSYDLMRESETRWNSLFMQLTWRF